MTRRPGTGCGYENQKASRRNGLLLPEKVAKLDKLLPDWTSPHRLRPSWDQMLEHAVQLKKDRGRWHLGRLP